MAVPRDSHAVFDPGPDRPDPIALLEEQAKTRVPELVPGPVGPDDGLPVHLLPRRGAADGQRPGHALRSPGWPCRRAGMRTCRTSASSARAERRLVFDVNDFDETLPGPWEWDVKRLAASMEVAGPRQRVRRQGPPRDRHGHGRQLPAGDARLRRDDQPGRLVRARGPGAAAGAVRRAAEGAAAQDGRQGHGQGADPGQHAGSGQADPPRGRPAADHRRPAADRPDHGPAARGDGPGDLRRRRSRTCSASTGGRWKPTGGSCSSSTSSPTWPARSSAWAASAPAAGSS